MQWITNNASAAKALRNADKAHEAARQAAQNIPLADKINAYRAAKAAWLAAYDAATTGN